MSYDRTYIQTLYLKIYPCLDGGSLETTTTAPLVNY